MVQILPPQPIRYLQKQVPFFLPSGYGVAEGNGATAPSPMKGLFSGAKRQPRSITRRFEEKRCCPTRFVANRWATRATNMVPVYAGTFLFAFGVWSCRRQRGESPKPDEKVVNKLFFCAQTFLFCPAGAESSSSCCFAGLPLCKHAKA